MGYLWGRAPPAWQAAAANRCVAAVADRVPAELSESMAQLVQNVDDGRSPADDFADRAIRHGIAPAVLQLARDGA